jgi:hypothetical protein
MSEKDNLHLAEQAIAALNARDLDRYVKLIDNSYVGESELAPSATPRARRRTANV